MPHKNIEDRRRYAKEYADSHPEYREKRALRNKLWREKNKESIREKRRQKYLESKEKNKQIAKNYYENNKEKQKEYHLDRAHKSKVEAIKLKGGKCSICGVSYNGENASIFDFHHVNSEEKEFNPKRLINNGLTEKVLKELDKCILVCSNCHRLLHNSKY